MGHSSRHLYDWKFDFELIHFFAWQLVSYEKILTCDISIRRVIAEGVIIFVVFGIKSILDSHIFRRIFQAEKYQFLFVWKNRSYEVLNIKIILKYHIRLTLSLYQNIYLRNILLFYILRKLWMTVRLHFSSINNLKIRLLKLSGRI